MFAYLKPSHPVAHRHALGGQAELGVGSSVDVGAWTRIMSHPFLSGSAEQQLMEEERLDIGKK